jgi:ATP-binding cassette subfamily E protein 1
MLEDIGGFCSRHQIKSVFGAEVNNTSKEAMGMGSGTEARRIAVLDKAKCIYGRGCSGICMHVCPVNRTGKECIILGEDNKPVISEELCIGCQICVRKCPPACISIINLAGEGHRVPLHQFGENAFRLYGLPCPKKSAVVGMLGRNGIGKSTALNILAGNIVPNLGDFNGKPDYAKVVRFFRGKEEQAFFTALSAGRMRLSYKPQNVDAIAQRFNGKVGVLLKRADEKGGLPQLAEALEIGPILEHDIGTVSGGELQRIAIAACLLKDSDIYFFDEPSSYLDVRQRLNVAKLLRELALAHKRVVIVEHDLAVLDYLSDYVFVLYGEPGAYGVVGNPKSTLNGINEFLDGFLRDENVRFREKELHFNVRAPPKKLKAKAVFQYPALEKSLGEFKLQAEPGEFRKGEVVGVLGPNAIGKTTLIKMFASELSPDNTALDFSLRVAYKPQYLKPREGMLVKELFSSNVDLELFAHEVDRRLRVKSLFERRLDRLSGGELQKVSVAYNLAIESDLVLLDEPSAFIDVEDRLRVADAIRSVVEIKEKIAIVVDHDILFQDYVSDSLIVFSGRPSLRGIASGLLSKEEGMNRFLREMGVTFRRDPSTGRPRANKPGSRLDVEQKKRGKYYYQ